MDEKLFFNFVLAGTSHAYNHEVENVRGCEYPCLKDVIYLDHAGSTVYSNSLIASYAADLQSNLYGNPHSDNTPSRIAGARVDAVRAQVLRFFGANQDDFDVIFTANATAAIKLVGDCLSHYQLSRRCSLSKNRGFRYYYHGDSHTSLVGLREIAAGGSVCLNSNEAVTSWIDGKNGNDNAKTIKLFAYPGQSNMTGRRLPRTWASQIRKNHKDTYILWDAAALASTSPLDLTNAASAPDFTAVSLYKIFGYPDVGCLIVRKAAAPILTARQYFGGGTVDMVINSTSFRREPWYARKESSIHEALEDGTLNFHSIMAIPHAIASHNRLFHSMSHVSSHCAFLVAYLYHGLTALRHSNGYPLVRIHTGGDHAFGNPAAQGPTVAMSVLDRSGRAHGYADVERHADKAGIYLRSGSVCNPGGMAYLGWHRMEDMRAAWDAGHRCSDPIQEVNSQPTGIVRVSLGAMSTLGDVDGFLKWLGDNYLDCVIKDELYCALPSRAQGTTHGRFSCTGGLFRRLRSLLGRLYK